MREWILNDIRSIIRNKESLREFLKIDDIKEMYEYCQRGKKPGECHYTEKEFTVTVEEMIANLENMYKDEK